LIVIFDTGIHIIRIRAALVTIIVMEAERTIFQSRAQQKQQQQENIHITVQACAPAGV